MMQKKRLEFIQSENPGLLGLDIDSEDYPSCSGCFYFRATEGDFGDCKRYPKSIRVEGADWCGEYFGDGVWSNQVLEKLESV